MAEGEFGEGSPRQLLNAEDEPFATPPSPHFIVPYEVPIKEKKLTFEEASRCLNTLGKDESGIRYAYLMITATDRKITDISTVLNFKHVLFLDFSGNFLNLEALQVVAKMPFLILLKVGRNRIESGALEAIPYLQVLDLSMNKIEETCDVSQPMLECLELEFNQIFTAQFDSAMLPNLKELDLKGNHLIDLSGNYPESLERLFLAQNKIAKIDGFSISKLTNLTTLHLRDNKIRKLNGFSEFLSKLNYLNLRNNGITKLRQFRKLASLPSLESIIIVGNPVQGVVKGVVEMGEDRDDDDEEVFGEDGPENRLDPIRIGLLVLLPNLKRINKVMVTLEEREEAMMIKDKKMEEIMDELSSEDETEPPTTTYTSDVGDESEPESEEEREQRVVDPRSEEEDN